MHNNQRLANLGESDWPKNASSVLESPPAFAWFFRCLLWIDSVEKFKQKMAKKTTVWPNRPATTGGLEDAIM